MERLAERPVRVPALARMKREGRKIAVLTAYDATMARLLELSGADVLLVGDSLGMVVLGHETTIPVTLDDMVRHTAAVSRAVRRPLVIGDLPFLTYQPSAADAVRNAGRLIQEGGVAAVKLEGGSQAVIEAAERIVGSGIPVMAHLGLTPQSFHQLGGFRKQAKTEAAADRLVEQARRLQEVGAFSIVLEAVPARVAKRVTETLDIPTIGIGAGPDCDGQVLVTHDVLGLSEAAPSFAKAYANLSDEIVRACGAYCNDVRGGRFPEGE